MKQLNDIWTRLTRVVIFLIVAAILVGVVACYWPVMQQNERMRKMLMQLDQEIQRQQNIERELRASIEALRNDPRTVERLLREAGYSKPGETVFRFEQPSNR